VLLRPTFIKKSKRNARESDEAKKIEERMLLEEERRRQAADEIVEEQIRKDLAAKAAGKKSWDEDDEEADAVDDTDGLDPEMEKAAWKLRELKRIKRERVAIEAAEKERDEIERRRHLSKEERDEEDREFIAQQRGEKESKGKMGYMQKYYHKGAFFQDDSKNVGLDKRDIMGSRYQDDVSNRELLPEYMQIRDMTKLGKKGRTKYKDLKSEDTGRWGDFGDGRPRNAANRDVGGIRDDRFMPDRRNDRGDASGANATAVGERSKSKREPEGPRDTRDSGSQRERKDMYRTTGRGQARSRSQSPRRDRSKRDMDRRKRSPSPYGDRHGDKRRRVESR
jgi:microfibrillar-associated protein 1